jgi:AraC family transcriptional regulator
VPKLVRRLGERIPLYSTVADLDQNNPRWYFPSLHVVKARSWGSMSVEIVDRAASEITCKSNCYRLTYFLTDFQAEMGDDERPLWESLLPRGNFVFRPPGTTLRSNWTAGRYILILQSPDTYANLGSEMVRGGIVEFAPRYNLHDPAISQFVEAIVNEIDGGLFDGIMADALNTAIAVQLVRLNVDSTKLMPKPAAGLSRERLRRVDDYVEAHLDDRLTLNALASVACLSPYHFSRSFKQAKGVGPQRYVTQRRLDRAKNLMRRTNLPLALIAQEAGFADQSHLTSVFRREVGVTPGIYRTAMT